MSDHKISEKARRERKEVDTKEASYSRCDTKKRRDKCSFVPVFGCDARRADLGRNHGISNRGVYVSAGHAPPLGNERVTAGSLEIAVTVSGTVR